jgi:N-acetylmuramoyl-L-alanine amidase
MRLRTLVIAAVLVLTPAACGTRPAHPRFENAQVPASVVETTAPPTTTTTTAPPSTTAAPRPSTPSALGHAKAVFSPRGVALTVTGHDGNEVEVLTPCENKVKLSAATAIATPTVILDAGHGGGEPGAVGPNGLAEKTVNLAVATFTKAALERSGTSTLLTRSSDYRMTLNARTRLVTALKPRVFVSIHHNSDPDGPHDGPGSETYYQVASSTSADSKRLAGLIYEEIVAALRQYNVAWVGDTDAGAKYRQGSTGDDYYAVLRQTKGVVSALAELAFINNPPEADLLAREDVQRVEGDAVARGITRYLTTADPGSGYTQPYARTTPAGGGGKGNDCKDPAL